MQPHLLVLTRDSVLLAALARAAAAAGIEARPASSALLDGWSSALVVVIGGDLVGEVACLAPPRRTRVLVVTASHLPADVHRSALSCGADAVLDLAEVDGRLLDVLVDAVDGSGATGALVAVVGGAGGVGASTLACALALTYADAGGALLVDADPDGGGVDRLLGVESRDGVRWHDLTRSPGRLSGRSLRGALPHAGDLAVLARSAARELEDWSPAAVRPVLVAGVAGFPVVVVDLARARGPVEGEVLARCDRVVLVTVPTVPALAASLRVARRLPEGRAVALVRGRGGVPDADIASLLGIPLVHRMPDQRGLDEAVGLGLGPLRSRRGPLARAARTLAAELLR